MPSIIACAPEHRQDDFGYFNSGVMVMNLPALRATADRLRATVTARLPNMQPHDDQGALNDCYRNEWDRLPNEWNWKPYWGTNPDAKLIHFHGPKPGTVRDMLDGNVSKFGPEFEEIFNRSPAAYREYLRVFDSF
jgi:lipopolysaccharide biosynthesis glycosyltransferase